MIGVENVSLYECHNEGERIMPLEFAVKSSKCFIYSYMARGIWKIT